MLMLVAGVFGGSCVQRQSYCESVEQQASERVEYCSEV
jgi:hypothetical protein